METVLQGRSKTVVIGPEQPFCIIGERINPTGRKKLAEELLVALEVGDRGPHTLRPPQLGHRQQHQTGTDRDRGHQLPFKQTGVVHGSEVDRPAIGRKRRLVTLGVVGNGVHLSTDDDGSRGAREILGQQR